MYARPIVIAATVFLFGVQVFCSQAQAQTLCGDHDKVTAHLEKKFNETRSGMGVVSNGGVLEVYHSEESGTWTVLMTMPGEPTCLIATGEAWESLQVPAQKMKGTAS